MLDAVLELQAAGHDVQLYTAHHDTRRCFAETLQTGAPGATACYTDASSADPSRAPQTASARHGCTCEATGYLARSLAACTR